jgi:beta-glucanase (GH16 family)
MQRRKGTPRKVFALSALAVAAGFGASACEQSTVASRHPPNDPPSRGSLIFRDEFNDAGLDARKWDSKYPRAGEQAYANPGNGEAQWYRRANVSEGGGYLSLVARRERARSAFSGRSFEYTSGLIQSKPSFSFERGYMEARVWLPRGSGVWPAFWAWPRNEQWPPEIDVFEFHGDDPEHLRLTYHSPDRGASTSAVRGEDWTLGWHTVGLEWDSRRLTWYVDGRVRKVVREAPDIPMYLILNLAISDGTRAPAATGGMPFPADLKVDYVRVWRLRK